jgi:hypothetical protein
MGDYNMAQLSSPGVSVSVIDESFYTPAAPGTVPLIIVASEEAKQNGSNTGTAAGTLKANAGQVYLLTSQKDLVDTFGTPIFKTDANNNPVHGGEQNEYGLQTAYSFLGVSNRAYVVRADVDLAQLNASATIPSGNPVNNTFWLDTASTKWGLFEWNSASADLTYGQTFTNVVPTVINDTNDVVDFAGEDFTPKASIGKVGSYAMVSVSSLNTLWYKKKLTNTPAGTWVEVGSLAWVASIPAAQGSISEGSVTLLLADSLTINTVDCTGVTTLSGLAADINSRNIPGVKAAVINNKLELYATDGTDIAVSGTTVAKVGLSTGTYKAPALQISSHTSVPLFKRSDAPSTVNNRPTGSLWIKTTTPNKGADWVVKKYNEATSSWVNMIAPLYSTNAAALKGLDPNGGGLNLAGNSLYVKFNDSEETDQLANFKLYRRREATFTSVVSSAITINTFDAGSYTFTVSESSVNSDAMSTPVAISFTVSGSDTPNTIKESILEAINTALQDTNVDAIGTGTESSPQVVIRHLTGGEIKFVDGANSPVSTLFDTTSTANFYADPTGTVDAYVASLWTSLTDDKTGGFATASDTQVTSAPFDGQLWYSSSYEDADIMVNDGTQWRAYRNVDLGQGIGATDPNGPIFSATAPTLQSDNTALVEGDLWVDTSDMENFPSLYKYINFTKKWQLVDKADQTSENGIVFADARWNTNGLTADPASLAELLGGPVAEIGTDANEAADFLDFDAPDATLYPKGMLLWNLRRSGYNVKKFVRNYVNTLTRNTQFNDELMTDYYPHMWVSAAANQEDGSGSFGRLAQRRVVIQALQATVNSNQQLRDEESRIFNLIACPGYPELITEMVNLNYDRGLTSFVVGDTPARLASDATTLSNWGNNSNGATEDGDNGLVTSDEYLGVFYPWGYTSDNIGNNVVVPPSHMMLRTIALSDQVSYPWFAPAGTSRGGITNASAVGYVDAEGEFKTVALNNGQRDTLASIKVNAITFISGTGLVNYAQYTRARAASSLDRINVARLVVFLRRQFSQLAKPYLFEPNDKITRDEIKQAAENLLLELVGQRALYDYVAVCDTSNNTPARIDRNELYLDIAIEPVKAVEFIYIPLRLKNTGEISGLS